MTTIRPARPPVAAGEGAGGVLGEGGALGDRAAPREGAGAGTGADAGAELEAKAGAGALGLVGGSWCPAAGLPAWQPAAVHAIAMMSVLWKRRGGCGDWRPG